MITSNITKSYDFIEYHCMNYALWLLVWVPVIYRDFPLYLTGFFQGNHSHLIQCLANKMQDFWNLLLHDYIHIFHAEFLSLLLKASSHQCVYNEVQQT